MTESLLVARRFMEAYAAGDADGLLASVADDWVLHEEDGSTTTRDDIAEITRSHADAFAEKTLEYLHELADGSQVAQHVRFTLLHTGRYRDLEATGTQVVLREMIFHRFEDGVISESWRMTYPDGVYASLQHQAAHHSG